MFGNLINATFDNFKLHNVFYSNVENACESIIATMYSADIYGATNLLVCAAAIATGCTMVAFYYVKSNQKIQNTLEQSHGVRHVYSPTRKIVEKEVMDVHHISGRLNPSERKILMCIFILNQRPELINHVVAADQFTPFLRACWSGNSALVRYMLQNGADTKSRLSSGENAIYLAAYRATKSPQWDSSVLDLLYAASCDVAALNHRGRAALHMAAISGHLTLARWLIEKGALRHPRALFRRKPDPYQLAARCPDINHQCIAALIHLNCPRQFRFSDIDNNGIAFY